MKTSEVLRTSRGLLRKGCSPASASFGDWPDAVAAFNRALGWRRWWPWVGRRAALRALDQAIADAEQNERRSR